MAGFLTGFADNFNKGLGSGISLFQALQQQQATQAQQSLSNNIALQNLGLTKLKFFQDQQAAADKGYGGTSFSFGFPQQPSNDYSGLTGQTTTQPALRPDQGNGLFTPINPVSTVQQPTQPQQQDPTKAYYETFNKILAKDLPGYTVDDLDLNSAAKFIQKAQFHKGTLSQFRNPENQKLAREIVLNGQEKKDVEAGLIALFKDKGLESAQVEKIKDVLIRGANLEGRAKVVADIVKRKPYLVGGLNDNFYRAGTEGNPLISPFVNSKDAQDFNTLIQFEGEAKAFKKMSEELGAAVSPYEGAIGFADIPEVKFRPEVYQSLLNGFVDKASNARKNTPEFYKKTGKELGGLLDFKVQGFEDSITNQNPQSPVKPSLQELQKTYGQDLPKLIQQEIINRAKSKQTGFKVSDPQPGVNFTPNNQSVQLQADILTLINQAADKYNLNPRLLQVLVRQESGGNKKAKSKAGAMGVMQLMPATAKAFGVTDPYDPAQNIDAGARYLSQLIQKYNGNVAEALAHYNGGGGAVQHFRKKGGIGIRNPYAPANSWDNQTAGYVNNILGAL